MQAGKYQPRTRMDEGGLQELAASIKTRASCSRSWCVRSARTNMKSSPASAASAAQLAGLEVLPVLVRDVDDQAAAAMALIENMQREDLNPLEEAQGIHRLITDFSFTHEQAATRSAVRAAPCRTCCA
jgi:ParB family chromosome partitioning protein